MTMDIYSKIERYSDLGFGIEVANAEKSTLIDSILTPEIKEKLREIDEEFAEKIENLSQEKAQLESEIKQEVLSAGRSIKGTYHTFSYTKGRVSWDTKSLDGYAAAHPEIERFRIVGNPSVSVRKS